jgi:hypothetical protein
MAHRVSDMDASYKMVSMHASIAFVVVRPKVENDDGGVEYMGIGRDGDGI